MNLGSGAGATHSLAEPDGVKIDKAVDDQGQELAQANSEEVPPNPVIGIGVARPAIVVRPVPGIRTFQSQQIPVQLTKARRNRKR